MPSQINGYDDCYKAGYVDNCEGTRARVSLCSDRHAYDDGWHDARRNFAAADQAEKSRNGSSFFSRQQRNEKRTRAVGQQMYTSQKRQRGD